MRRDFRPFLAGVLAPRLLFLVAGSAVRIERLAVMARPGGLYGGEITGKGYVNQRQVLIDRSTLVELFYAQPTTGDAIVAGTAGRTA